MIAHSQQPVADAPMSPEVRSFTNFCLSCAVRQSSVLCRQNAMLCWLKKGGDLLCRPQCVKRTAFTLNSQVVRLCPRGVPSCEEARGLPPEPRGVRPGCPHRKYLQPQLWDAALLSAVHTVLDKSLTLQEIIAGEIDPTCPFT